MYKQTRQEAEEENEEQGVYDEEEGDSERSPFDELFTDLKGDKDYFRAQLSGDAVGRGKFLFLYDSSKPYLGFSPQDLKAVLEQSRKVKNGLHVEVCKIDLAENRQAFTEFLQERNPNTDAEKQINESAFVQVNRTDDLWFWDVELVHFFYGEILEQIFNFYQGPMPLLAPEQLLMNQCGENDIHLAVYMPSLEGKSDEEKSQIFKQYKAYRKYNTKNTDKYFHIKMWQVSEEKLAEELGISTKPEDAGDIYMLRQSSHYNENKSNIKLADYDFESVRIAKRDEA